MRLNRNLRIGLALIGAAFLVWAASRIFGNRSSQPVNTAANNSARTTPAAAEPVVLSVGAQRYVALSDIPERTIITRDMFGVEPLPRDAPEGAYITDMALQGQGYITRNRIAMNSSLRPSDLIGHISDVGVAGALRPGLRAMIVPIANKPTLHDLVHVGDYVDVIAAFDQQEARTVVQNVRVLAVDVFGKDFPQVRIAARGDYKAEARGIGTANPGSPINTGSGPTQRVGQGDGAGSGTPSSSSAPPAATATPAANGQPPAKPEPAITLEVTPDQATALSLSQASNAPLDFILRPRPAGAISPETRVAASLKPNLAPFATQVKNRAAGGARNTSGTSSNTSRNTGTRGNSTSSDDSRLARRTRPTRNDSPGDLYTGSASNSLPPLPVPDDKGGQGAAPPPKEKYFIPVYGGGQLIQKYPVDKPGS